MHFDVVTVAYNSGDHLRDCIEPLAGQPDIHPIVVDNACPTRSPDLVRDLPGVTVVGMGRNAGFGAGCNAGARAGDGDAILFLNPDASMTPDDLRKLARAFEDHPRCGAVGPHIAEVTGETQLSIRRLPTLASAFSEALYLHHLLRGAPWASEVVKGGYDRAHEVEWLSGAVVCIRRAAFEEIGGFDERLFMYSEDTDIGVRLRHAGWTLRYEPSATSWHVGGGSAPRPEQAALKATARITYARIHERGLRYAAFRVAFALYEAARIPPAAARSRSHLRGRLRALHVALGGSVRLPG
jgi:N-acetylglucosaminyl-diphospho-decaprenol L-rhamnosyltransferase